MYYCHTKLRAKNSLFLLGSVLLHLILLFILSISKLGVKKSHRRDQFELNAIRVANLMAAAQDRRSTKGDSKSGEQARKKSKFRLPKKRQATPSKKTKLAKISRQRPRKVISSQKTELVKMSRQQPKELMFSKNTKLAQISQQPKNTPKQVEFKATKKITMLEKTIHRQEYTIDRKPVTKKQLNTDFSKLEVKTYQETTVSIERTTKMRTITRKKVSQIETKIWQNVTKQQVSKQLKPVQSNLQRQTVAKRQREYLPHNKNQPLQLAQIRLTYKQQNKNLDRRLIEEPKLLEVTKPTQVVKSIKHIAKSRRVSKKNTVVTRREAVTVLKDSLALEKIPLKTSFKRGSQQIKQTPQREVAFKQVEYEERIDSAKPFKPSQARVIYEQKSAELNKKVITAPETATELVPTEPRAVTVGITTVTKQEADNYPTLAHTPSITQLPTVIPAERQNRVEKTTTFSQTPTKTELQRKLNIQKTDTFQEQRLAFKKIQLNSFSTPLPNPSAVNPGKAEIKIKADLPNENVTANQLYRLIGTIDSDVRTAFLTVNDVTQLITVVDGAFVAEVALAQGLNELSIMAFNSKGKAGRKSFQLLFNSPVKGILAIKLESPENGRQGVKQGESIMVKGTIDDPTISKATLLLNRTPIPLKVKNGRFHKKIILPPGTIFVFRVMAQNKNGVRSYSPAHTVLSTRHIDILNPRPY